MSASNVFARGDGAWLAADTACYHHDGTILTFESKIVLCPRLHLAIARSGRVSIDAGEETTLWLDRQADQATALAKLPDLVGMLKDHDAEAAENGSADLAGLIPAGLRLMIAWWDAEDGRGRAATIATCDDGSTPAFSLRTVGTVFSPPIGADEWQAHSFDPDSDAFALAQRQRQYRDERGIVRVGGSFEVDRVHAGGIDRREIVRWSDQVGKPIRIDPCPSLATRAANALRDLAWALKPRNRIWL